MLPALFLYQKLQYLLVFPTISPESCGVFNAQSALLNTEKNSKSPISPVSVEIRLNMTTKHDFGCQ